MKYAIAALWAAGLLVASALGLAPAAQADPPPCASAVVWGNGGSQCDSAPYDDGSFDRFISVYVFGIGGTNCFRVYPTVET